MNYDEARAAIKRVRKLHQPITWRGLAHCATCSSDPWPCPTIRALDPPRPDHPTEPTSTGDGTSP